MEENIVNQTTLENPIVEEKLNDVNEVEITSSEEKTLEETDINAVTDGVRIIEVDESEILAEETEATITEEAPVISIVEEAAASIEEAPKDDIEEVQSPENDAEDDKAPEIELTEENEIIEEDSAIETVVAEIEPIMEISQPEIEAEHETLDAIEPDLAHQKVDYSSLSKLELLEILEKALVAVKGDTPANLDFKKADNLLKDIKPIFDTFKNTERKEAFEKFKAENESEEGFEYKENEETAKFDQLYKK